MSNDNTDDVIWRVPGPYEPPFESPIEDTLAWFLVKYLSLDVSLNKQYKVRTICGEFRVDFAAVAKIGRYRVGYECDGRNYHDEWRDEWRDAMILGDGLLDSIVRFRGSDITFHVNDVLYVASCWDPVMFSERGTTNLCFLASSEAKASAVIHDTYTAWIAYHSEAGVSREPDYSLVRRRCRNDVCNVPQYWHKLYSYAKKCGGGELDHVIAAYEAESGLGKSEQQ